MTLNGIQLGVDADAFEARHIKIIYRVLLSFLRWRCGSKCGLERWFPKGWLLLPRIGSLWSWSWSGLVDFSDAPETQAAVVAVAMSVCSRESERLVWTHHWMSLLPGPMTSAWHLGQAATLLLSRLPSLHESKRLTVVSRSNNKLMSTL